MFGPPGMPPAMTARLSTELQKVVADREIQQRLVELSGEPVGSTPEQLSIQLRDEIKKWRPIIQAAGLKAD